MIKYFLLTVFLLLSAAPGPAAAADPGHAVVFLYHRFGEGRHPTTNISVADFETHIEELAGGRYNVLPLPEIIAAIRDGRRLPPRTVGLSIDDGFASAYAVAWPRLAAAGLPFTLFVATDAIDGGGTDFMNWNQIREMARDGVTIGHHSASHGHLAGLDAPAFGDELARGTARMTAELGVAPTLLAYPFGETSRVQSETAAVSGFAAAFGQHSGVVHAAGDLFYLPRFSMTGSFAGLDRLRMAAAARPLTVTMLAPADPKLASNRLDYRFELADERPGLDRLACFVSGRGAIPVTREGLVFTMATVTGLAVGRTRINCTVPNSDGSFAWLGMLYYLARQ